MIRACLISGLIVHGWVNQSAAEMGFGVSPPRVDLTLKANEQKEFTITITNHGQSRIELVPGVFDFRLDKEGSAIPMEQAEREKSCGGWLEEELVPFSLAGNEAKKMSLHFKAPRGVRGGYYCALLFEGQAEKEEDADTSVEIGLRTGTLVLVKITRTGYYKAEIADFTSTRTEQGIYGFDLLVKNTGNIHLTAQATVMIYNPQNKRVLGRVNMDGGTTTILPGGTRHYHAEWQHPRADLQTTYVGRAVVRAKKIRLEQELDL